MTPIEAVLAAIKSLLISDLINYTKIAKEYGVDQNTLSRRHRGVQRLKND
jgi:transposase-like protein